jgi:hypothetical protein
LEVVDAFATVHRWQTPLMHEPPRQLCPHAPQLAASEPCVFVHVPLQFVCPEGQPQVPLLQTPPTAHEWPEPHAPQ